MPRGDAGPGDRLETQSASPSAPRPSSRGGGGTLTQEQLAHVANLVARGEAPLPDDSAEGQLEALARLVRQQRRERLLQHIAVAIALDLRRAPDDL